MGLNIDILGNFKTVTVQILHVVSSGSTNYPRGNILAESFWSDKYGQEFGQQKQETDK